jgi:hypothetical protein
MAERFGRLALEVFMQNDGYFVNVILVCIIKAFICRRIVKLEGHTKITHDDTQYNLSELSGLCVLEINGSVAHFPGRSVR